MNKDMKIIKKLEKFLGYKFDKYSLKYNDDQSIRGMNAGRVIALEEDSVVGIRCSSLTEVPELVRGLTNLKFLDLSSQDLKELPEWLTELVNLEWLDLRRNQLTILPESIGNLTSLQRLWLLENQLTNLPEGLKEINNLKYLDLSKNQFTTLPECLLECNAEELKLVPNYNLEWNQKNIDILKALDNNTQGKINFPGIFKLHVRRGVPKEQVGIIVDLRNINNVDYKIRNVVWKDFDEEFKQFEEFKDEEFIDIRVKEGEIAKIGIIGHGRPRGVILKTLPENFGDLKYLSHLTLRHHRLESLPNSFGDLTNLEVLDLSENDLKSLPDSFVNLTSITKLNLSNCQFSEIPTQLWALKELTELKLDNNPLSNEENNIIKKVPDLIREYLRKKATIRVFISHAVIDFEPYRIGDLVDYLEKQKEISQVLFCEEDLAGNIDEWMLDAIQKCQLILFIGTNKSVFKSVDCTNELQLADKFSIPVIPLKGKDVDWPDLAERNLSRELGLEYDTENFDDFCSNVYKYIENIKREINLLEKEERRLGIIDIYERFRLMLDEKLSEMFRKMDDLAKKNEKIDDLAKKIEKIDELAERMAKLEEKVN